MDKKEFDFLVLQKEGYNIEFKERFSDSIAKDICAFANASGGRILIGISDDGKIKGVEDSNKIRSEIQDLVRNFDPKFNVSIDSMEGILIITILEGRDKPYSVGGKFYLRQGPNSQQLTREEIKDLFQREGLILWDEKPNYDFHLKNDFNVNNFKRFLEKAKISRLLNEKEILDNLSLLKEEHLKNAGVLLFCNRITKFFFHATISCVLYQGKTKYKILDKKEYDADLCSNFENAFLYLKSHLNTEYIIKGGPREERLELPEETLREALLNAIAHRNYTMQSSILVEIFSDRVEITNPGGLVKGITKKDLGKKSLSRNNLLFGLMQRMGLVEKVGSGIARMRRSMKEYDLRPPRFDVNENWFTTKLYRKETFILGKSRLGIDRLGEKLGEKLGENEKKILEIIPRNNHITTKELSEEIGISTTAIDKNIAKLKEKGILKRIGPDKGGYWEILSR